MVPLLRQTRGRLSRSQLQLFARASREITRPYVWATSLLLFLNCHPVLADRVVQAMARNPDILAHLFSAQMGQAGFWPGWSRLVRLLPFLWGFPPWKKP